ncbi:hypothetical protein ACFYTQ_07120 [Nocardia sp. NPDC004068]|uniref:hypothetical protein n=1 Tax=Nocardia sp. NPDC004068 TaxID=3364303 RepID=UPI0036D18BDA
MEIARALEDTDYFRSLRPDERDAVVAAGGIGAAELSDDSLESVSSGLEGGAQMLYTGTDSQEEGESQAMVICTC